MTLTSDREEMRMAYDRASLMGAFAGAFVALIVAWGIYLLVTSIPRVAKCSKCGATVEAPEKP